MTVLDLSSAALAAAKDRLGARAADVRWLEANIIDAELGLNTYDLWHDRAVFNPDQCTRAPSSRPGGITGGLVIWQLSPRTGPASAVGCRLCAC